jgi:hypothetical protein
MQPQLMVKFFWPDRNRGLVFSGPVQLGSGLFSGPMDWTLKH